LLVHLNFESCQQKTCASKILLARARKYLHPEEIRVVVTVMVVETEQQQKRQ
jgi:hypothetical protein